jgi:hypothetical protein
MKIIKTNLFAKGANKNEVSDKSLLKAASEIANDNYEANYGGGVIKKRVANKKQLSWLPNHYLLIRMLKSFD